jgi:ABC-type transport system involved in cytochrome c biogenesis permease subunit
MDVLWVFILIGYGISTIQAIYALTTKRSGFGKVAAVSLGVAIACHTLWLLERGIRTERCPLVGTRETFAFLSWSSIVLYLVSQRWFQTSALKAFIFPIVLGLAGIAAFVPGTLDRPDGISEPLQKVLFPIHAGLIMLAFAAFFIAFGAGLMYIIQERELKSKRFSTIFYRLPSLDKCDAISLKSMVAGFILLTLGITAGFAWSRARDGVYWHGEPIEIFSVSTWVIYLLIIQSRLSTAWGGRRGAFATIAAFVLVICSLAGVRYLGNLHVLD